MAEPDARAIPDEELDPGAPMIVKGVPQEDFLRA